MRGATERPVRRLDHPTGELYCEVMSERMQTVSDNAEFPTAVTAPDDPTAAIPPTRVAAKAFPFTPMRARVLPAFKVWWVANQVALTEALVVFLSARVVLSLVAFLAMALLPEQAGQHVTFHRSANILLDAWARWDSEYYLDIAQYGYALRPELTVFFPFYPLLLALAAPLLGQDYVLAGVVVSSVACFVSLFYLFKLVAWEFSEDHARRAVLYMAVYPMALFLFAVYTESVFLALTIAAFYYTRRKQWAAAAVLAVLAGITRPTGILLVFPMAYEAWRHASGDLRKLQLRHLLAVAAAPVSWIFLDLYLATFSHDPLAILHSRALPPFSRFTALPWETLLAAIQYLGHNDLTPLQRAVNNQDLIATLLLLEASVVAWWTLPRAYAIYMAVSAWFMLSSAVPDWALQSMPRYTLSVFPIFLLLAQLGGNRHRHRAIVIISLVLLGMYTALFVTWYWVF
jgi:hypothetical protein